MDGRPAAARSIQGRCKQARYRDLGDSPSNPTLRLFTFNDQQEVIAEDFPAFRRFISSTLGESLDLRVIAEVSDGLEAVQKAAELKPDLILLDIGLPTMGIEAARQIRKLSPESQIVFLSQETSADIVEEALSTGAWGYVVKTRAASQLLAVVKAATLGVAFATTL
jgi:DNA-binding NarL/FixJ family response regulator